MSLNQTPHLLPLFRSIGWQCLEWKPNIIKGKLTDEMPAIASLIDGTKSLSDLAALGVDMRIVNQLIEQDILILAPGRIANRELTSPTERWSVISPHSDDAALSIGGTLAQLKGSVEISILTMIGPSRCAGTCAPLYGDVEVVTKIRMAEDDLYGEFIAAKVECANIHDVEMYIDASGSRWSERIMDKPDDFRLNQYISGLKAHFESHTPDVILAPLAVGAHSDHAATYQALQSILPDLLKKAPATRVMFYEDLPYCQYDQAALVDRLEDFDNLKPIIITIDPTQKATGISIYRSQYIAADIAWDVLEYAEKLSEKEGVYVERLWELSEPHVI